MKVGLLGKKIGMTRVYDATGKATPVTVIEAGGNSLLQTKTAEKDGYQAIQVGFDAQKESRLPKPLLGHFKKAEATGFRSKANLIWLSLNLRRASLSTLSAGPRAKAFKAW